MTAYDNDMVRIYKGFCVGDVHMCVCSRVGVESYACKELDKRVELSMEIFVGLAPSGGWFVVCGD
jgi:hypothetical protein